MKEITVKIDKAGRVHFDFNGFQGSTCFVERKTILELLRKYGVTADVEYEEKKPEAYEEVEEGVKVSW